jgi:hypothetical protein
VLEPGESLTRQFVDVTGNGNLTVYTDLAGTGSMTFYAVRADFPDASAAPQIAAAPAAGTASPQWTLAVGATSKQVTVPVNAGRWYLVAHNIGSTEVVFDEIAHLTLIGVSASVAPGAYYNPLRSGHGIFMNDAAGQRALYWYTYLENGTPVWYQAAAPTPAATDSAWSAPLVRVAWDGATVNATTTVGDVILTPINATEFMFSWHLYGTSGSEHFVLLGDDECVNLNGAQADLTGQWYAPAQSGYGVDVLVLPSLQNDTFYLYDSLGQPRWAAGSVDAFAADATVQLGQYSGFCPSCAYTPVTSQAIGTLDMHYASALQGSYATNLNLVPPLSGSWNINQPIARLTGKANCSP